MNKYEKVILSLDDFYTFYNLIVTFSMTASMKPANREQYNHNNEDLDENNIQWNSTYPSGRPRASTFSDGKICAICFSKSIQIILPCTVREGYFRIVFILFSMVSAKSAVQDGMKRNKKLSVQCAELKQAKVFGIIKLLKL